MNRNWYKNLHLRQRFGSYFFRKRSDKMRKELEEAAREGNNLRSGSPLSFPIGGNDLGMGSLTDLSGTGAKAAGFYSDTVPSCVHMKFVSLLIRLLDLIKYKKKIFRTHMMEKLMLFDGVLSSV